MKVIRRASVKQQKLRRLPYLGNRIAFRTVFRSCMRGKTGYSASWLALSVAPAFQKQLGMIAFSSAAPIFQVHRIKFTLHVHRFGWMAISHQRIIRQGRADFLAFPAHRTPRTKYSAGNLAEIYMNPAESASYCYDNRPCFEFPQF